MYEMMMSWEERVKDTHFFIHIYYLSIKLMHGPRLETTSTIIKE